ncbi:hypothetical protein L7F22_062542 [Adiantum nelumboides]|nr:hypothetical protein [Adiantum nelumboides]
MAREVENPYQELKQLLEGKPSSKKKGHAQHEGSPSNEREGRESQDESMEDVAPRRRRAQRSPTPTKQKRSPHSPHRRESKREEKSSRKKKERKRSPSSPSSSPSSSFDKSSGYSSQEKQRRGHQRSYDAWKGSSKLKKFKEGGKNSSFLTYDGTFGTTNKVLAFIQQFDAAFGDEGCTESSKLRHIAIHFPKSAMQWWASLRANGEPPKTWKALRASIMKQFLASNVKDKVLTKWRSLKPYESIHKYVDKFWDLHLRSTVYKKIDFEEQKQQFCAGLLEDMNEYVNSQRPRSISAVIHHTMLATMIKFQQGSKRNLKPMEVKDKQEYKGKNLSQNSSKAKEKGVFKEDIVPKEQPEVEELDEILVPEQILAHKDRKVRGKVARRYLVKFKNYSPMDAKWMEEAELPKDCQDHWDQSPTVCRGELSEEAFGTWGLCSDQFWSCYAAKILLDRCYAAGYSLFLGTGWFLPPPPAPIPPLPPVPENMTVSIINLDVKGKAKVEDEEQEQLPQQCDDGGGGSQTGWQWLDSRGHGSGPADQQGDGLSRQPYVSIRLQAIGWMGWVAAWCANCCRDSRQQAASSGRPAKDSAAQPGGAQPRATRGLS